MKPRTDPTDPRSSAPPAPARRRLLDEAVGRRRFLEMAAAAPLALASAGGLLGACGSGDTSDEPGPSTMADEPTSGGTSDAAEPSATGGGTSDAAEPSASEATETAAEGGDTTALVTEVEAMAANVKALQYTNHSPKAEQHCSNCRFFTPKTADRGQCQLFPKGRVSSGGWCSSWSAPETT